MEFVLVVQQRTNGSPATLTVIPGFGTSTLAITAGNHIQNVLTSSDVRVTYVVVAMQ